jgi:hypothetical protein
MRLLALVALVACDEQRLELPAPDLSCPAEGWCWVRGRPLRLAIDRQNDVVFGFGPWGELRLWHDGGWLASSLPSRSVPWSAWMKDDLWVSDERGSAWRLERGEWRERSADLPIGRLIGTEDGSLWATAYDGVGAHGAAHGSVILRWTGSEWVAPIPRFEYCLGSGDYAVFQDEVWTAGLICDDDPDARPSMEVRRWDGANWVLVGDPFPDQDWYPRFEIVGDRARVRATGLFEWDGSAWQRVMPPIPPQGLPWDQSGIADGLGYTIVPSALDCSQAVRLDADLVWCSAPGQIYVQENAGEWRPTLVDPFTETSEPPAWGQIPPSLWAGSDTELAWGSGPNNVYRVRPSSGRKLERFDGTEWSTALEQVIVDVDGHSERLWAASARAIHFSDDGRSFNEIPMPDEEARALRALPDGSVLVITEHALLSYDGAWSTLRHQSEDRWKYTGVAGSSSTDIWLVSYYEPGHGVHDFVVEHFDGMAWTSTTLWAGFVELATASSETWQLARIYGIGIGGTKIQRLGSNEPPLAVELGSPLSLWIGPDALWLVSPAEAMRHPR